MCEFICCPIDFGSSLQRTLWLKMALKTKVEGFKPPIRYSKQFQTVQIFSVRVSTKIGTNLQTRTMNAIMEHCPGKTSRLSMRTYVLLWTVVSTVFIVLNIEYQRMNRVIFLYPFISYQFFMILEKKSIVLEKCIFGI